MRDCLVRAPPPPIRGCSRGERVLSSPNNGVSPLLSLSPSTQPAPASPPTHPGLQVGRGRQSTLGLAAVEKERETERERGEEGGGVSA